MSKIVWRAVRQSKIRKGGGFRRSGREGLIQPAQQAFPRSLGTKVRKRLRLDPAILKTAHCLSASWLIGCGCKAQRPRELLFEFIFAKAIHLCGHTFLHGDDELISTRIWTKVSKGAVRILLRSKTFAIMIYVSRIISKQDASQALTRAVLSRLGKLCA